MIEKSRIKEILNNKTNNTRNRSETTSTPDEIEILAENIYDFISGLPREKALQLEEDENLTRFMDNYLSDFEAVNLLKTYRKGPGSDRNNRSHSYELDSLILEYTTYIQKLITKYFPDLPHDIGREDLAQDVIIKILLKIDKFYFFSRFTTWLYRVIINVCYEKIRNNEIKQFYLSEIVGDAFRIEIEDPTATNDFERMERIEFYREFRNTLRQYIVDFYDSSINKDRNVEVFEKLIKGKSRKEIADEMGINLNTLNSIISRFRKKADINDIINEHGNDNSSSNKE